MIDYLIGQDSQYEGIDRILLPGKPQSERHDLSSASMGIAGAASKFQKTKYQILKTLMVKEQKGQVGQGTWQELTQMLPIEGRGVKLSCWRMNHGYINAGIPRYHHPYIWLTPQKKYRLLNKGRRFVDRMEREQPDLTKLWCLEMQHYWKELKEIKDKIAIGRKNWIKDCISKGIKPKGVTLKELKEIRSEAIR